MNDSITVKSIVDETFQDYKKTSMFISFPKCDFKCFRDLGLPPSGCQNFNIINMKNIELKISSIFQRYIKNQITESIVLGGLEPFLSFNEVYNLVSYFRSNGCDDDFVIYSGYYPDEIEDEINDLKKFKNIIVKFGRYIPNANSKYDEILGVTLVSDNQFSIKIS